MLVINQADQEVALRGDLPVGSSRRRRRRRSHSRSLMLLTDAGKHKRRSAHAALYVVLPAHAGRPRPPTAHKPPPPGLLPGSPQPA